MARSVRDRAGREPFRSRSADLTLVERRPGGYHLGEDPLDPVRVLIVVAEREYPCPMRPSVASEKCRLLPQCSVAIGGSGEMVRQVVRSSNLSVGWVVWPTHQSQDRRETVRAAVRARNAALNPSSLCASQQLS